MIHQTKVIFVRLEISRPRMCCHLFFFFSSRRRHTRCGRDWSSDVCSSDLFVRSRRLRTMASPARSDETWSLVATTRELVVMAPLASGEVMTAPLRCGWVRDCGGEVRVLQRDGALAGGPAGVSRGGVGVDDPPNVTEPRTEIPEPWPWNVTPGARRVVSLLLRHPSLGGMPRTPQPVPAPAGQDAGLPQPVREPHGWAARL